MFDMVQYTFYSTLKSKAIFMSNFNYATILITTLNNLML